MTPARATTRVRLPSDVVLTSRSLVAIGRKLATDEIGRLVDALIDELDARAGDPDDEPDHDGDGDLLE